MLYVASCLSLLFVAVEGHNHAYTINAVAGWPPNIDGTIATGEWADASAFSFNNTGVYVKQDGENLYIALNVSDSTLEPDDYSEIGIDVLNDGGSESALRSDDIVFLIKASGALIEVHGPNASTVTPTGWTAESSHTNDYWQAEFNITYAKVRITSGETKTLGLVFMTVDDNKPSGFWPPINISEAYPSNWGDLTSEENWIPEFSLSPFLLLLMTALLLATVRFRTMKSV